jgi:hypothetical protein
MWWVVAKLLHVPLRVLYDVLFSKPFQTMASVVLPPHYLAHYSGLPQEYVRDNALLQTSRLNRVAYYQPRYSDADRRLVIAYDDKVLSIGNVDVTTCAEFMNSVVSFEGQDSPRNAIAARGDVALRGASILDSCSCCLWLGFDRDCPGFSGSLSEEGMETVAAGPRNCFGHVLNPLSYRMLSMHVCMSWCLATKCVSL